MTKIEKEKYMDEFADTLWHNKKEFKVGDWRWCYDGSNGSLYLEKENCNFTVGVTPFWDGLYDTIDLQIITNDGNYVEGVLPLNVPFIPSFNIEEDTAKYFTYLPEIVCTVDKYLKKVEGGI